LKQAYDYWQNQPDLNCVLEVVFEATTTRQCDGSRLLCVFLCFVFLLVCVYVKVSEDKHNAHRFTFPCRVLCGRTTRSHAKNFDLLIVG